MVVLILGYALDSTANPVHPAAVSWSALKKPPLQITFIPYFCNPLIKKTRQIKTFCGIPPF